MKPKFAFNQRVTCDRYISGSMGTVPSGTGGIVRDVRPQHGAETRYLVAFPVSSNSAHGVREYWTDESNLTK